MRLFIAIDFDEKMKLTLKRIQDDMRSAGIQGRYTPIENLHLTLAFLGEYHDPDQVLDIIDQIPFGPTEIQLDRIGRFGDLYWVGIKENTLLEQCVRRLRRTLSDKSIPYDRKRFSPHITILRKAQFSRDGGFPEIQVPDVKMEADHISLFRSDRGKRGMIYTELY